MIQTRIKSGRIALTRERHKVAGGISGRSTYYMVADNSFGLSQSGIAQGETQDGVQEAKPHQEPIGLIGDITNALRRACFPHQWALGPSINCSAVEMTHSYLARFSTGVTHIQCLTVSSALIGIKSVP